MAASKSFFLRVWGWIGHVATAVQVIGWWQAGAGVLMASVFGVWAVLHSLPVVMVAFLALAAGAVSVWLVVGIVWLFDRRSAKTARPSVPRLVIRTPTKPFEIEPVKRRGQPKTTAEYDIYLCLTIRNKTGTPVRECTGRLVKVAQLVDTPDGTEKRAMENFYPVVLQWSLADGGGASKSFVNTATLDVAVLERWGSRVFQIVTAEECLRSSYRLEHQYPTLELHLTVEVAAMNGPSLTEDYLVRLWPLSVVEGGEPSIDFSHAS